MEKNDPGDHDGQAPLGAPKFGADVSDRMRVVRVNVELEVLEIGWVIEHVEYQTGEANGSRRQGVKMEPSRTSW